MDVRVLRYFLAVAEEGSISGAAEKLHMSQPNLSRQISSLERELGTTLLVRGNRKAELTESGELLKVRAEEIVSMVDGAVAELSASDFLAGTVRIGGGETRGMSILFDAARAFRERHPAVRFDVRSGNAEDVTGRLDRGEIDMGLLIEPVDKRRYDFIRLPARDVWGVLMRADDPLASRKSIRPSDLRGLPLIISSQGQSWNEMSGWFGTDVRGLDVVGTYNLLYNASLMVAGGMGHALCLDGIVNAGADLCFRPLEPRLEVGMVIAWRKDSPMPRAPRLFLEELRGQVGQLSSSDTGVLDSSMPNASAYLRKA